MKQFIGQYEYDAEVFYQDSDTDEDDIAVDISAAPQEANDGIEGTIVRRSGEESDSEDDDDVDHTGNEEDGHEEDDHEEDEDEHGCNEGYESEDDSGEDTEDQGPAPPSKRKRVSRVYFVED